MKQSGIIEAFTNGTISYRRDDTQKVVTVLYQSNGNFNHTYIGEHVEIVLDYDTGVAIDCINKRHRVKEMLG